MRTTIGLAVLFFCLIPFCLNAQQKGRLNCTASGSDSALIDSARSQIVYGLTGSDQRLLFPGKNGSPGAVQLSMGLHAKPLPAHAIEIKGVRLLAWHEKQIGPLLHTRSALIWSHYMNVDSAAEWALLVLSCDVDYQRWVASQREDQPLMRFSHAPTNEDVRGFLDQLNGIKDRMLSYNKKGVYDWSGVAVAFMGGEVCAETWEEVIGEKPLPLFPKGK